jgi:hypothetical protein
MSILESFKLCGFAYLVLTILAFMVAGLIQCMTSFLKAKTKKS